MSFGPQRKERKAERKKEQTKYLFVSPAAAESFEVNKAENHQLRRLSVHLLLISAGDPDTSCVFLLCILLLHQSE